MPTYKVYANSGQHDTYELWEFAYSYEDALEQAGNARRYGWSARIERTS